MRGLWFILFLLVSLTPLSGQWFSIDGSIGVSRAKSVENIIEETYVSNRAYISGLDTTFIRTQSWFKYAEQQRITAPFAIRGALRYNLPLNEKLFLSVGLEASLHAFTYYDEAASIDSEELSRDTLDFAPTDFFTIGGGSSGGLGCDTILGLSPRFEVIPQTANYLGSGHLSADLSYVLIKDKLNCSVGMNVGIPLYSYQSHKRRVLRESDRWPDIEGNVCVLETEETTPGSSAAFSNLLLEARLGAEALILPRTWLKVSWTQNFTPLNNTDSDLGNRFNIPFKLRPGYLRLGLTLDLVRRTSKWEEKRHNYLLKKEQ